MDKPKILIVEDDLDLAEMLQSYFRVQNYDVLSAAWGEEAVQISRDNDLQLIVLDIRLPDIDGYEVCRQLRTQRRTQDTPIIFLTEKRDRVDKLQGLELGVVDYITKPFDIQELRLRVRNAINRANRHTLVNPVTDLPEGRMVDERLQALLTIQSNWAVLKLTINSLNRFREMYGFVAADDVLRAVTLMVRNAVREHGNPEDFIGHDTPEDFVIITQMDNVQRIQDRIENRIQQSREYFYPLKDRDKAREAMQSNYLKIDSVVVNLSHGPFEDLEDLKKALESTAPDILATKTNEVTAVADATTAASDATSTPTVETPSVAADSAVTAAPGTAKADQSDEVIPSGVSDTQAADSSMTDSSSEPLAPPKD